MKNEIRVNTTGLRIREAGEENKKGECRTIEGCAIVFNRESQLLDEYGQRFTEIIAPSCVSETVLRESDIKLNMLHDRNQTIARKNTDGSGNLKLELREDGLYFEFEAPKCDLGDRALEMVRSGVYTGCSFEFSPQDYEIQERGKEDILITHTAFRGLYALTIGMDPAYTQTSVNCRELHDQTPEGVARIEAERRDRENNQRQREIEMRAKRTNI